MRKIRIMVGIVLLVAGVSANFAFGNILIEYQAGNDSAKAKWQVLNADFEKGDDIYCQGLSPEESELIYKYGWKLMIDMQILRFPLEPTMENKCPFVEFRSGARQSVKLIFGSGRSDGVNATIFNINGHSIYHGNLEPRHVEIEFKPNPYTKTGDLKMSVDGRSRFKGGRATFNGPGTPYLIWRLPEKKTLEPAGKAFLLHSEDKPVFQRPLIKLKRVSAGSFSIEIEANNSSENCEYIVEHTDDLVAGNWQPYGRLTGTSKKLLCDHLLADPDIKKAFFRVRAVIAENPVTDASIQANKTTISGKITRTESSVSSPGGNILTSELETPSAGSSSDKGFKPKLVLFCETIDTWRPYLRRTADDYPLKTKLLYENSFDSLDALNDFKIRENTYPVRYQPLSNVTVTNGQLQICTGKIKTAKSYATGSVLAHLDTKLLANSLYTNVLSENDGIIAWSFNVSNKDGGGNNSFSIILAGIDELTERGVRQMRGYRFAIGGMLSNRMMLTCTHRSSAFPEPVIDVWEGLGTLPQKGSFRIEYNPRNNVWFLFGEMSESYVEPMSVTNLLWAGMNTNLTHTPLPHIWIKSRGSGLARFDNFSMHIIPFKE